MIVFSTNGKITPEDDKTNIKHTFTVGAGVKSLTVKYSYSPKVVEDKSLATLAVTNAMKKYKVESLNRDVVLNIHYAGCDIDYEIEIDAKEEKQ